jgi:hypothetical protein
MSETTTSKSRLDEADHDALTLLRPASWRRPRAVLREVVKAEVGRQRRRRCTFDRPAMGEATTSRSPADTPYQNATAFVGVRRTLGLPPIPAFGA